MIKSMLAREARLFIVLVIIIGTGIECSVRKGELCWKHAAAVGIWIALMAVWIAGRLALDRGVRDQDDS